MDELRLLLHSKSPKPYEWVSDPERPIIHDRLEDITSRKAFQIVSKQVGGPSMSHPGHNLVL